MADYVKFKNKIKFKIFKKKKINAMLTNTELFYIVIPKSVDQEPAFISEPSPKTLGFHDGSADKESACQCRRHRRRRFDPWAGKIP